ncbi:DNA-binding GntR family transcriptional regulator [Lachnospiraceae bacterium PF1-21]|uniref:GntR family transcriptional regulator n=1 Tax=Ohessyouella blattaphilus TaxID=2949333 RepID=UPI003E20776B
MKNNQNIKDIVYKAIVNDILSYEYRPNEVLNEKTLVEKYGYSKTPIREALQALCNDNVLRNIPRYGYEIVRITSDDVGDMLQYRYILESGLLKLKYKDINETQIKRLEEIDAKCTEFENDIWEHWKYNTEFHLKLMAFCQNAYALNELENCMSRLKIAYAQFYWNSYDSTPLSIDTRNHAPILSSLRDKNLEKLLTALKDDLSDFGGANYNFNIVVE